MLQIGDVVVHPRYGLAIVEETRKMKYEGKTKIYYCLRLERGSEKSTVMIPETAVEAIGLRTRLLDRDVIEEVMSEDPVQLDEDVRARQKYIASTSQSGDPRVLIGLLRDLCWIETVKTLSQGESKARKHLLDIVENELSLSQNIDSDSAQKYLGKVIDEAMAAHNAGDTAPNPMPSRAVAGSV